MKWKRNPLYVKRVRIVRVKKYALKILKLRKELLVGKKCNVGRTFKIY